MRGSTTRLFCYLCFTTLVRASSIEDPIRSATARFDVNTTLVLVPVTVIDRRGSPILTLSRENFQLTEDDRPQRVAYFVKEEAPVSVAIVVDLSGSMARRAGVAPEAVARFLNNANEEDEFCLIELRDQAELVHGFGTNSQPCAANSSRRTHCAIGWRVPGTPADEDSKARAKSNIRHLRWRG
jgi:VWFA-related protein